MMNEGTYRTLIMEQAKVSHTIRSATIEMLDYCNFRCMHCYIRDTYHHFINTARLKSILCELRDTGCIWLLLTGGEILLHPDFWEIYKFAYQLGFKITLFTNGYLLSDQGMDVLRAHKPELLEVTVYGSNAERFDKFVQVEGAFLAVNANIDKLIEAGINIKLKSIILAGTEDDYTAIKRYSETKGLECRYDFMILPTICGEIGPLQKRISFESAVNIDAADKEYLDSVAKTELMVHSDELYTCGAGYNSVFIDANCNISICTMARHISVPLGERVSIIEAQSKLIQMRESKAQLTESNRCYRCGYRKLCRYCPGQFLLATGDEYTPIQWNCNYAKMLYQRSIQARRDCNAEDR